jgi:hypothetical protein
VTYQTQGDYLTPTDKIKPNLGPTIVDDIRARSFSRSAIKNDSGAILSACGAFVANSNQTATADRLPSIASDFESVAYEITGRPLVAVLTSVLDDAIPIYL